MKQIFKKPTTIQHIKTNQRIKTLGVFQHPHFFVSLQYKLQKRQSLNLQFFNIKSEHKQLVNGVAIKGLMTELLTQE